MIRRIAILGLVLVALGCGRASSVGPTPGTDGGGTRRDDHGQSARVAAGGQSARAAAGSPSSARVADGGPGAAVAATADSRPTTVRVLVRSAGPKMHVSWGRKYLGTTPLSLRRPRDSGPLDLVLRASDYFPVHARAYTYSDDTIVVRPTRIADRMSLLGARKELPPEGDGGVPPTKDEPRPAPRTAPGATPGPAPFGTPGAAPFGTPGAAPFGTPSAAPGGTPGAVPSGAPRTAPRTAPRAAPSAAPGVNPGR
jgi:hypothetical protein